MFYFKDDNQISIYLGNGDIFSVRADSNKFTKVYELCKNSNWVELEYFHNQTKILLQDGKVTISEDTLTVTLNDKVMETVDLNIATSPLMNLIKLLKDNNTIDTEIERIKPFLINVLNNKFINATNEIVDYCKALDFEITDDGCFLAYKKVNNNLTSIYDGRTQHAIGEYTEEVDFDTNRNNTCSKGLHFCSKSYLSNYGSETTTTIIVKINPSDVVSIPTDYNFTKGRCRKYLTIGVLENEDTLSSVDFNNLSSPNLVTIVKPTPKIKPFPNRITETYNQMKACNNNAEQVAKQMGISFKTVKRNMYKYDAHLVASSKA